MIAILFCKGLATTIMLTKPPVVKWRNLCQTWDTQTNLLDQSHLSDEMRQPMSPHSGLVLAC
jgi:hypothetical protein